MVLLQLWKTASGLQKSVASAAKSIRAEKVDGNRIALRYMKLAKITLVKKLVKTQSLALKRVASSKMGNL